MDGIPPRQSSFMVMPAVRRLKPLGVGIGWKIAAPLSNIGMGASGCNHWFWLFLFINASMVIIDSMFLKALPAFLQAAIVQFDKEIL